MNNETSNGAAQRPTFLTVLIILTWVGSLLGLLGLMADAMKFYPAWYKIAIVVFNLGTAIGAFLMWGLKKNGLIIYTIAEIGSMIMPFVILSMITLPGYLADGMMSFTILLSIFPVAFIIMYWLNAKHLK
ncbi:MAG: hypothetical protein IT222_02665 [Crocinitomix sp.]|nr:hypothetical protein [Crocinitomix sp.]